MANDARPSDEVIVGRPFGMAIVTPRAPAADAGCDATATGAAATAVALAAAWSA